MWPTIVATLGTLLGAAVGAWASQAVSRVNVLEASRRHALDRLDLMVCRVAQAYAQARETVEWLSENRLEDSVIEPFKSVLAPEYERLVGVLRTARPELDQLAVIGPSSIACKTSLTLASSLGELDASWSNGRSWADHYHYRGRKDAAHSQ